MLELIATILDYLPGPDLIRFALTSRRMRDMVYDDTRWIRKLRLMGCWNEAEARRRHDEARRKKLDAPQAKEVEEAQRAGSYADGTLNGATGRQHSGHRRSETLFDASIDDTQQNTGSSAVQKPAPHLVEDGFSAIDLSPKKLQNRLLSSPKDTNEVLQVMSKVRSIRGSARQEYGKIHGALAPYYFDLLITPGQDDSAIFRTFQQPEQRAQMLSQVRTFAKADIAEGGLLREEKVDSIMGIFENAALREFEQGVQAEDVDGDMRQFANVLVTLNGGSSAVDVFIQRSSVISNKRSLGRPTDALSGVSSDNINLQASADFFRRLAAALNEQALLIDRVFPSTVDVLLPFVRRAMDDVISDYVENLFREARGRTLECYLKAVSNTYDQMHQFGDSLKSSKGCKDDFAQQVNELIVLCLDPHVDPYMEKELEYFKMKCDAEVEAWDKQRSQEEASTESLFMSNVTRQAAKSDFLKSFRKVVMMPVNAFPAKSSPSTTNKPGHRSTSYTGSYTGSSLELPSRTGSPIPSPSTPGTRPASPSQRPENLPTTELAAKTAIMNSRLEGIRSLFSIEVALNLIHLGKASIERLAIFAKVGSQSCTASKARESCETIFISLIKILGVRHIKGGFDKAVDHLANYNPRDAVQPSTPSASSNGHSLASPTTPSGRKGVAPLVTFLELVNVGDMIQQMVDLFFIEELITPRLVDPDDFLDAAIKEKKRFEQMLDERVAAGLNKGIDVLLDEVEFV
ncbi:MAG: hypothetical protein Q9157_006836, partial [Trypethelium eluteriae]